MKKKYRGFSLLEIIVAITILAIIGVVMVTGLRSALQYQIRTSSRSDILVALQSTMMTIERDIQQIINRPILDEDGKLSPAVILYYIDDKPNLEFTHAGYINPFSVSNRSTLQRVSYFWDGKSLLRTFWPTLDRVQGIQQTTQLLLDGVKSFQVNLLYEKEENQSVSSSSQETTQTPSQKKLPRAIELKFDVEKIGTVTRLIPIAVSN